MDRFTVVMTAASAPVHLCNSCQLISGNFVSAPWNWTIKVVWWIIISAVTVVMKTMKEHENMHSSCLISRHAAAGGLNCVEDILLAHSGPINTKWAMFKCHSLTWYNHVNLFLTTVSTLSDKWWNLSQSWDYLKSFHLTSKLTRCHSISPRLRCGGVEDLHCGGEADKSAQCYLISMSHSLSEWAKISEGWNLSVTILYQKQRKHKWSNEMFEASPSLSPFLWEYMTL